MGDGTTGDLAIGAGEGVRPPGRAMVVVEADAGLVDMGLVEAGGAGTRRLQAVRHDGWTPARRQVFLTTLAMTANVAASARAAGMGVSTARKLRARSEGFAMAWHAALEMGRERLREEVLARALAQLKGATEGGGIEGGGTGGGSDASAPVDVGLLLKAIAMAMGGGERGGRGMLNEPAKAKAAATQAAIDRALLRRLGLTERPPRDAGEPR